MSETGWADLSEKSHLELLQEIEFLRHHYDAFDENYKKVVSQLQALPAPLGDEDVDGAVKTCLDLMRTKGVDYTGGSPDRLWNFRQAAEMSGLTMRQVWFVYWWKHVSAIISFVKTGKLLSESVESRCHDTIVFTLLFLKMLAEEKRGLSKVYGEKEKG